jgi:dTDP-4-amino-4,6-dideoxygalactose transaminase
LGWGLLYSFNENEIKMKFVDLEFENSLAKKHSSENFKTIDASGKYLLGEFLEKFENSFSQDQSKKFCVGVKNATDALAIAFRILEAEKRTVIVPQFGAYPTVMSAIQASAKNIIAAPVDNTLCLDLKNVNVPKDSIIVPVNLFGNESNIKEIRKIADENNCQIIEDCAQSTGIPVNNLSDILVHSFYPTKPLGSRGDGGAILTNNELWASMARKSRFYGLSSGYIETWGFNSRMDEWQSSFLEKKISYYKTYNEIRRNNAKKFSNSFKSGVVYTDGSVFHQYVSLWKNRDKIQEKLNELEIPTIIHYPKMLSDMPYLQDKVKFLECPRVSDHILSIPVGPHLDNLDIEKICDVLNEIKGETIDFSEIKSK